MSPVQNILKEYEKDVTPENSAFSPQLIELAEHLYPLLAPQLRSKRKTNGIKTIGDLKDETEQFNAALHHLKVHNLFLFLLITGQFHTIRLYFKELIPSNKFWALLAEYEREKAKERALLHYPLPIIQAPVITTNQLNVNYSQQELLVFHATMYQMLVQERTRLVLTYTRARAVNYATGTREILVDLNRTIDLV